MCSFRYLQIILRGELDGSFERPEAGLMLGFAAF
jgi:hypothetical protein